MDFRLNFSQDVRVNPCLHYMCHTTSDIRTELLFLFRTAVRTIIISSGYPQWKSALNESTEVQIGYKIIGRIRNMLKHCTVTMDSHAVTSMESP